MGHSLTSNSQLTNLKLLIISMKLAFFTITLGFMILLNTSWASPIESDVEALELSNIDRVKRGALWSIDQEFDMSSSQKTTIKNEIERMKIDVDSAVPDKGKAAGRVAATLERIHGGKWIVFACE